MNFTICSLIILGGLSFGVLTNFAQLIKSRIKKYWLKKEEKHVNLSLNSKVVLITTLILLITAMLIIYQFEHANLVKYDIKTQYLSAFFQAVTLRTAGFNTIQFNTLNIFTYLIMIFYMFIGGAAGSTAGGIKVNTIGTIYAYIKSIVKGENNTVLMKKSVSSRTVNNAFLIVTLYLVFIFFSIIFINISDGKDLIKIIFEVVSAIGTVGLSTGITSTLTSFAKIIIVVLMFFGRVGPLTILTAMEQKKKRYDIRYPEESIHLT
jgi:trk system potassium uptake protein TrkH